MQIGRLQFPEPANARPAKPGEAATPASGCFRLWNPYYNGYLAEFELYNSHRRYLKTERQPVYVGPYGMGNVEKDVYVVYDSLVPQSLVPQHQALDVGRIEARHIDAGSQFQRSTIQPDAAKALATLYTGTIDPARETAAVSTYRNQCWFIQDRSQPAIRAPFPELDQLDEWERKREHGP
jgi:hypothetical protein